MIHILLPVFIFCLGFFNITYVNKMEFNFFFTNALFFIGTITILVFYMFIKSKQFVNPFQNYFGFGDFLFYLSLTPMFLLKNYILFFTFSMVFAILIQKIFKKPINQNDVPLAGLSALLLILVLLFDVIASFQKITLI